MRTFAIVAAVIGLGVAGASTINTPAPAEPAPKPQPIAAAAPAPAPQSAYEFKLTAIDGSPLPLDQFRGQVVLLVNTASMCGFTPQYDGLQKLQEQYAAKGFTVLGVPSDDFGGQEYADNKQIAAFCESRFGITFPMAEQADVKGDKAIPLFRWASAATGSEPRWNFHKYLIGRDGKAIAAYGSRVAPQSAELTQAIETALATPQP
jgi:glutathione peroxidase